MLHSKLSRPFLNKNLYQGTVAQSLLSRSKQGGFLPFLPSISSLPENLLNALIPLPKKTGSGLLDPRKKILMLKIPMSKALLATPMLRMQSGRGFFEWIKNAWNWIKPAVTKAVEIAKPLIPKIQEIIPQAVDLGKNVIEAIKNKDTSQIGTFINQGKDLFNKGLNIGKDVVGGVKSIKDIIEDNRRLKQLKEEEKTNKNIQESNIKSLNSIREGQTAEKIIRASNLTAETPSIQSVGGETVKPVTGTGLVTKLLRKHGKALMRGRGFKKM